MMLWSFGEVISLRPQKPPPKKISARIQRPGETRTNCGGGFAGSIDVADTA